MAGHSHWARIKRKKAAVDSKRGRVFGMLAKAIMAAARHGGGDPAANLALRYAIEAARAENMPRATIERAILKGTGELGGGRLLELVYEGYAPGGAAVLVPTLTDNSARTSPEIRQIFEKHGGRLGTPGSVAWLFEKKALFTLPSSAVSAERLLEIALEAGADDVADEGASAVVTGPPDAFARIAAALEREGLRPETREIAFLPKARVALEPEAARRVLKLVEALEEHEDVQAAITNADLPAEVLAELAS
jgi:YebC/PmpR family DNA-binding regulatory protein